MKAENYLMMIVYVLALNFASARNAVFLSAFGNVPTFDLQSANWI